MAVKFGKPGTKRFTGKLRAQLQKANSQMGFILAYSAKQAQRVPPVTVLTPAESITLANARLTCQTLLATVNL